MNATGSPLYAAGGAIFHVLGALHAVTMLVDLRRPRRLVPGDPALTAARAGSRVRLAGDASDMWRAWIGFKLGHSLGALLLGATAIAWSSVAAGHDALAWVPAAVAARQLAIGLRFWFSVPNAGIALATAALAAAALLGWAGDVSKRLPSVRKCPALRRLRWTIRPCSCPCGAVRQPPRLCTFLALDAVSSGRRG